MICRDHGLLGSAQLDWVPTWSGICVEIWWPLISYFSDHRKKWKREISGEEEDEDGGDQGTSAESEPEPKRIKAKRPVQRRYGVVGSVCIFFCVSFLPL